MIYIAIDDALIGSILTKNVGIMSFFSSASSA
jgi:hypothetical protein